MIKIIIDDQKVNIIDDDVLYFSFYFLSDEFICEALVDNVLIVNRENHLYDCIKNIMNNSYSFEDPISFKTDDKLVWLSDQYGELDDKNVTDRMSRFVIEKGNDIFKMYCYNPFMIKNNIKRNNVVSFSPGGNGRFSCNMISGSTFQDDMVLKFYYSIKEKNKKNVKKI